MTEPAWPNSRPDGQVEAYGKFGEEPTVCFFLDDVDHDFVALRRTEHHQRGPALQMCTVGRSRRT